MKTLLKTVLLFLLNISFYLNANAQKPITWQREYGSTSDFEGNAVIQTFDGGFLMCGQTPHGYIVIRINEYGDTIWRKSYGDRHSYKLIQTSDSNFIIVGFSIGKSGFYSDGFIQKLSRNGNQLWKKKYGRELDDNISDIKELQNKNLLCVGSSSFDTKGYLYKTFLMNVNQNGDSIWAKYYESSFGGSRFDFINENRILISGKIPIITDSIGNLIRNGLSDLGFGLADDSIKSCFYMKNIIDSTGSRAILITKTDTMFNMLISRKIDFPLRELRSFDIIKGNSGFVICGFTLTDIPDIIGGFLLKFDQDCNIIWYREHILRESPTYYFSISNCIDNGFISVGAIIPSPFGSSHLLATKMDSNGNTNLLNISQFSYSTIEQDLLFQNFPNPFNSYTKIKFKLNRNSNVKLYIFDILGREIELYYNKFLSSGFHQIIYSTRNDVPSGIYFYNLKIENKIENINLTRKFILIK